MEEAHEVKKLNLKATVDALKKRANGKIINEEKFDEMMSDPEFVLESCLLWNIKPIYE